MVCNIFTIDKCKLNADLSELFDKVYDGDDSAGQNLSAFRHS